MNDDRPPAARRYETEERELSQILQDFALAARDGEADQEEDRAIRWLLVILNDHRTQAYAEGYDVARTWKPTWWDRNWFGVVFLGLIAAAMVMIGLINGWS
jgi:hypothetical protein